MAIPTGSTAITDPNDPTKQASVDGTGALKVAATFSAASVAINDGTTTSQKLAVDSNGKIGISSMPAVTATNPSVGTTGSTTPTSATEIGASDGTNLQSLQVESSTNKNLRTSLYNGANEASVSAGGALKVDNSAVTQPVSAASLPLPAGASTAAKQPALGTAGSASADVISVQGIASMTALKTDGSATTQPVSAASLPLPSGAATSAKQPALGTAGSASTDVLSVQGVASMTALKVDGSAVTQPVSGTVTVNAGTNTSTASLALETGGNLATLAGAVTSAKVQANVAQVNGVAPSMGNGVSGTGVQRVTIASDSTGQVALAAGSAVIGSTTIQATSGTALAADVSNTELRVSNYVKTSAAGDTALTLGQATMANSLPVTMASNQGNIPTNVAQLAGTTTSVNSGTADNGTQRVINAGAATGTKSSVASSASSVTILASNTSRKGAMVYNDSTQILYLDLSGGTASSTSYSLQIPANGFFELPAPVIYNGAITGIWAAANGNARVTEFS